MNTSDFINQNKLKESKKRIIITEEQFHKLINEDVFIAAKDNNSKKANLTYVQNQSYNKGNLKPSDKLKTDKMDTLNKDTYEVPLKGGLIAYNITSINGSDVMHYFKRIFNKQSTTIKLDDEEYELEMKDSEFMRFMMNFIAKVNAVVHYQSNKFKSENPDINFTDFAVYPVPSSSRFNSEMARRLMCVFINGLKPRLVDSNILKKDFTKVKKDDDFINKNKDYYSSLLNSNFKDKTHIDNVTTTQNKLNAYNELKKRVDIANDKAQKLLNIWRNRIATSNSPTYYERLYKYYMDYVEYLPNLQKQDIFYNDILRDKTSKVQFKDLVQDLKYSKGPSIEKRSNEILQTLKDKGFINWHGKKKAHAIVFRELKPLQIKSIPNDVRMGLTDYFSIDDDQNIENETNNAKNTILLVFDDNISGGATLSDICLKLRSLGFKFIIPITFGEMKTQYNLGTMPINRPKNFNY